MIRGRCKRCLWAGELIEVIYTVDGIHVIRIKLCEHCAIHDDTPAINCDRCMKCLSKTI